MTMILMIIMIIIIMIVTTGAKVRRAGQCPAAPRGPARAQGGGLGQPDPNELRAIQHMCYPRLKKSIKHTINICISLSLSLSLSVYVYIYNISIYIYIYIAARAQGGRREGRQGGPDGLGAARIRPTTHIHSFPFKVCKIKYQPNTHSIFCEFHSCHILAFQPIL